jgi:hypothetical protein
MMMVMMNKRGMKRILSMNSSFIHHHHHHQVMTGEGGA